jgi:phage protein D
VTTKQQQLIAGVQIKVAGADLDPDLASHITDVRVEDHLMLPDAFTIRIGDPTLKHVDSHPLEVGAEIEIMLGASSGNVLAPLLSGQVTSVEPEFAPGGATIVIRGYDHSHALNRSRRSETYQNSTVADIAKKVATRAGLTPGTIDDEGGVQNFVQQNNETDYEFLWRLAERVGCEVVVLKKELNFRKAGGAGGNPVELKWGEDLIGFRPRLTGVQQVEEVVVRGWDSAAKRVIEATAKPQGLLSTIGVAHDKIVSALSGGTLRVLDKPVATQDEATALAKSVASKVANAYLEATGTARGNPALKAGAQVKIDGVGTRFGGTYTLSATTHVYRGAKGYETQFSISGRAPRSLVSLATPTAKKSWGNSVVLGTVTQNDDPDGLGRVRVKYGEHDTEGWWAPVVSPGAGKDKGLLMTPIVGDQVVVAFEHDDVRKPYVLGAVWNGSEKPADLAQTDGSFSLQSDKKMTVGAKEKIAVTGEQEMVITVGDAKITLKKSGEVLVEGKDVKIKASGTASVESSGSMTVKGSTLSIQASGSVSVSGASISLG